MSVDQKTSSVVQPKSPPPSPNEPAPSSSTEQPPAPPLILNTTSKKPLQTSRQGRSLLKSNDTIARAMRRQSPRLQNLPPPQLYYGKAMETYETTSYAKKKKKEKKKESKEMVDAEALTQPVPTESPDLPKKINNFMEDSSLLETLKAESAHHPLGNLLPSSSSSVENEEPTASADEAAADFEPEIPR